MKRDKNEVVIPGTKSNIRIRRLRNGYPHIKASEEIDLYYGLGYSHGRDRQMQMWLLKLIGNGKASEFLRADENLIETDTFMRWLNLTGDAVEEAPHLIRDFKNILDAYCKGVNDAVLSIGTPFEFKLVGYTPDEWTPADSLLIAKMIGFVGLSQIQGDAEKLILQLIQNDLDIKQIKELFPSIQEELTEDFIQLIKKINLVRPIITKSNSWRHLIPDFSASNNWVLSPKKTNSEKAILCGDPHLALQLPPVWYLAVLSGEDTYLMGATVPGLPIIAIGRTPHLAWSATYGTADVCDYFIEEVKNGKYRQGKNWIPFIVRNELIRPKKKKPINLKIYETKHGILEGNPKEDGYYLSYGWTGKIQKGTAAQSFENALRITRAKSSEEAFDLFTGMTFASFNWVFADRAGNIGYQLGGLVPKQPAGTSGLLPYLGWDKNQEWDGIIDPHLYPRAYNPKSGFIVTANQNLNDLGRVGPMKLPMSGYRAVRITQMLKNKNKHTVEDMKQIQYDRYSLQAEAFMSIVRPLLPNSENGKILRKWDLRYSSNSLGATLFERIYHELVLLVFGENGPNRSEIVEFPLFSVLHGNFDRILLSKSSVWFGKKTRESLYGLAIKRGLRDKPIPHGKMSKTYIENLFFNGKLPRFLKFDYPLKHIGSPSTIPQAQRVKTSTRSYSFGATFRMICDFADDTLHMNIAGGASDRRFSKYYTSGLRAWEQGEYEKFEP